MSISCAISLAEIITDVNPFYLCYWKKETRPFNCVRAITMCISLDYKYLLTELTANKMSYHNFIPNGKGRVISVNQKTNH